MPETKEGKDGTGRVCGHGALDAKGHKAFIPAMRMEPKRQVTNILHASKRFREGSPVTRRHSSLGGTPKRFARRTRVSDPFYPALEPTTM